MIASRSHCFSDMCVPSSCVHDDVRKLIKYSMGDMLAAAASDQALDFWHNIVDPFFGLPPQQREASIKVSL